MSYNPPPGGSIEPTGGNETRNVGGNETHNVSGQGETPGQSGQPTMPTGDYNPQGGYVPPQPPPAGGYPPPQGGYTPPPGSGYGGYGAPPPPPPGYGGYGGYGYGAPPPPARPSGDTSFNMGNIGKTDFGGLAQKWITFLTKPNVAVHEAEIQHANWTTVWVNLLITTLVKVIASILALVLFSAATTAQVNQALDQLSSSGNSEMARSILNFATGAGIIGLVLSVATPVFFFLGVWLQLFFARMFGGPGSAGDNFLVHSYLSSMSFVPTRIIQSIVSLLAVVPGLGILSLAMTLYQIYLNGLSLQASQRMPSGRAQQAAWMPALVYLVAICLLFICAIVFAVSIIGANR